jgi:hypothetical protein
MFYSEIIAVCSEIHTKHINTLCGQNVELLNVKRGDTYSNHWALCKWIKKICALEPTLNLFTFSRSSISYAVYRFPSSFTIYKVSTFTCVFFGLRFPPPPCRLWRICLSVVDCIPAQPLPSAPQQTTQFAWSSNGRRKYGQTLSGTAVLRLN